MKTTKSHFVKAMGNCGVSIFFKSVFIGVMLIASHASLADAELDRMKVEIRGKAFVEVTTTRDVQQKINMLPLAEKKRAKAAIKVGAAYVKVYLHHGSSCAVSDYWDAYMGGLTQTDDAYDWVNNFCGGKNGYQNQAAWPMACSPVLLMDFQFKEGGVILEYRITRLGGLINTKGGGVAEFSSQGAGDARRFTVSINANNRIYDIDQRGDEAEIGYIGIIEDEKIFLKTPTYIGLRTPEDQKVGKVQLGLLIQQIEQQASKVCK